MADNEGKPNIQMTKPAANETFRHSDIHSPLDVDRSSLSGPSPQNPPLLATEKELAPLISQIETVERVAIDTEADSLHCYREKLCLLQISLPAEGRAARNGAGPGSRDAAPAQNGAAETDPQSHAHSRDFIVDPLAKTDLAPLSSILAKKEIVLHGADFDLRLMRRSLDLVPKDVFDTVIGARLIGIREFSLAALVLRFFGIALTKGSQKANWAQRPLSARMREYAINDTRYLLPLAQILEMELDRLGRLEWFRQSCRRALEQSAISRSRENDEPWRISGAGAIRGRQAAVLRQLWQWREQEAEAVDRPPFHILQNRELLAAADSFAAGGCPDYKHFSARRRQTFRDAAEQALKLSENEWPIWQRRSGTRPTPAVIRRTEELRRLRDDQARQLDLETSVIAARATLEALAADESRGSKLLVPWQQQLLGL